MRRGDLSRLSWSHIQDDRIVITIGKSGHRREAIIPLYDGLRDVLTRIPKRSPIVLTSSKGRPWSKNGFAAGFNTAKNAAGIGTALHLHDLRGHGGDKVLHRRSAQARYRRNYGGGRRESVAKIIRKYVDRSAVIKDIIRQLNKRTEWAQTV